MYGAPVGLKVERIVRADVWYENHGQRVLNDDVKLVR